MKHTAILNKVVALVACVYMGNASADLEPGDVGLTEPIPSYYQDTGGSQYRGYVQDNFKEKVDPFTGKLQIHIKDLSIPGPGGFELAVQRSYSSLNERIPEPTAFGMGWTMHFGRVMRRANFPMCERDTRTLAAPVLELPDGSRQILYLDTSEPPDYITVNNWKAKCDENSGGLIVYSPEGTRYEMTERGVMIGVLGGVYQDTYYTKRIVDKHGNSFDISYQKEKLYSVITGVTASDGRSLSFGYQSTNSGSPLLKSVSDGSRTIVYNYEQVSTKGHAFVLKSVDWPEGKVWKYEYNMTEPVFPGMGTPGSWSIRSVTQPEGASYNYEYGFVNFAPDTPIPISTVVKKKKTGTEEIWDYAYTPATSVLAAGSYSLDSLATDSRVDRTVVTGPEGVSTYYHVGYKSAEDGNFVYLMGGLLGRKLDSGMFWDGEVFGWAPLPISEMLMEQPGYWGALSTAARPLMTGRNVGRTGAWSGTSYSDFDDYGNPQTVQESGTDIRTTSVTYFNDPANWIIGVPQNETISNVGSITRVLNSAGLVTEENRFGVVTGFTYTGAGDLASKTDARNNTVSYSLHMRGIAQREDHPEGVVLTRVVDGSGNVKSETDGENRTTGYAYDGLNRVTKITPPRGSAIDIIWGAERTITYGTSIEKTSYDEFDRPSKTQHTDTASGIVLEQNYRYDPMGRRTFISYPNSSKGIGLSYGVGKQVYQVKHNYDPGTQSYDVMRQVDDLGYLVRVTNERNKVMEYYYRFYGNVDARELANVKTPYAATDMSIERNGNGQPLSIKQDGVERSFVYDGKYFMTSSTDPEIGTIAYGRDGVGNMTSKTVGGVPTTYGYDDLNRLETITYSDGTPNVTRTYYKDSQLKSVETSIAIRKYLYNENGDLGNETLQIDGQTFSAGYDYNDMNAMKTVKYGSGRNVTYNPDALGRATEAKPYVTKITRHPTGDVATMTLKNGVKQTVELNERQWPRQLKFEKAGKAFLNASYIYDDVGNVKDINDLVDDSYDRTLGYDDVDRLTSAKGPWGDGSFAYDGRGNIRNQSYGFAQVNYNYSPVSGGFGERLTSVTGAVNKSFSYDSAGNVVNNGVTNFLYNSASQMTCAKCGKEDQITYTYDGAGMRVKAQDDLGVTYFMHGRGGKLLYEKPPSGRVKEYIYVDGKEVATREQ